MRLGAWLVILVAFIGLLYFHRWTLRTNMEPVPQHPAEFVALKQKVRFANEAISISDECGIPADINDIVKNMNNPTPDYVNKSRGVSNDSDYAPAQFGADNSELDNYFEKLRADPDVYSFTPVPTLQDQQNPKTFQTELMANAGNLNPVPFYDGIVAYEDFEGTTYQSL